LLRDGLDDRRLWIATGQSARHHDRIDKPAEAAHADVAGETPPQPDPLPGHSRRQVYNRGDKTGRFTRPSRAVDRKSCIAIGDESSAGLEDVRERFSFRPDL